MRRQLKGPTSLPLAGQAASRSLYSKIFEACCPILVHASISDISKGVCKTIFKIRLHLKQEQNPQAALVLLQFRLQG